MTKKEYEFYPYDSVVYINIVQFQDGRWAPCWYSKWLGASNRSEAVAQRRELLEYLQQVGGSIWKPHMLRTIKYSLNKFASY